MIDLAVSALVLLPALFYFSKVKTVQSRWLKWQLILVNIGFYFYFLTRVTMNWFHLWNQNTNLNAVGVAVATFTVLTLLFDRGRVRWHPTVIALGLFVVVQGVLIFYKVSGPMGVLFNFKDQLLPVLWFFVALRIDRERVPWFSQFLGLYVLVGGLYTVLYQVGVRTTFDETWFSEVGLVMARNWWQGDVVRFWGLMSNFQEWYGLCALAVIHLFGLYRSTGNRLERNAFLLAAFGFGIMNLLAPERSAVVPVVVGTLLTAILVYPKGRVPRRVLLTLSMLACSMAALGVVAWLVAPSVGEIESGTTVGRLVEMLNPLQAETVRIREVDQWATTLELIRLYPEGVGAEVLGTGTGTVLVATHSFYLFAILAYSAWGAALLFAGIGLVVFGMVAAATRWLGASRNGWVCALAVLVPHLILAGFNPVLVSNWAKYTWFFTGLALSKPLFASSLPQQET